MSGTVVKFPTGDDAIAALFGKWLETLAAADAIDDDDEADVVHEQLWALEHRIYDTAATGAAGMAIKAYFIARSHEGVTTAPPARGGGGALGLGPHVYGANDMLILSVHALKGLLMDSARFAPELEPLVAGIISTPVKLRAAR